MNILILGASGMLGHSMFQTFFSHKQFNVWGTIRDHSALAYFSESQQKNVISSIDVLKHDNLMNVFERVQPQIVINCIGLIKQLASAKDPLIVLPINSLLPHQLAKMCALFDSRLIHVSTDCVFSGKGKGNYLESDVSDAEDLYGKSKFIGEVNDSSHVVTLRTSIIGHELNSHRSLVDWFLSQDKKVSGYTNAIYTGLPTAEFSRVIRDVVIPNSSLHGLYQVASAPINKYELLCLIAEVYGKKIIIEPDDSIKIDRSLSSKKFEDATRYKAPQWPHLVELMYQSKCNSGVLHV